MPANPQPDESETGQTILGGQGFETFISDALGAVDAPEPAAASAEFVYNFFTRDERTEHRGGTGYEVYQGAGSQSSEKYPRFVRLSFRAPSSSIPLSEQQARSLLGDDLSSMIRVGFLNLEESVSSEKFGRMQISPDQIDVRLGSFVSSLGFSSDEETGVTPRSFSEIGREVSSQIAGTRDAGDGDEAATQASNQEIGQAVVKYINSSGQSSGISYARERDRKLVERNDIIASRSETLAINKIVLDRIARASTCNTNNLFVDAVSEILSDSGMKEQQAIAASIASGISADSHDMSIRPFKIVNGESRNRSFLVGYTIEKLESRKDDIVAHPTYVLNGATAPVVNDYKVNYGSIFRYRVRAVFVREMQVIQEGTNNQAIGYALIASSGESAEATVTCEEIVPPPEIADFRITYDFQERANRLDWSLPVNSQRDIKYFQIFKRKSTASPFRLIHVIDFDDSTERSPMTERYSAGIVEAVQIPKCVYTDTTSASDREEIYAICTIDAHGFTSGYSTQIGATFRPSKNSLAVRMVSREGAPKTYPNLYLNEDTFSDVIRVSDRSTVYTFFDPEAIGILSGESGRETLSDIAGQSTFTISFINEDSALGQSITLSSGTTSLNNILRTSNITGDPDETIASDLSASVGSSFP